MQYDLTGKKYERLTVISFSHIDKNRSKIWKCLCDCGKEVFISTGSFNKGETKSCGCYKNEMFKISSTIQNTRIWIPIDNGNTYLIPLSKEQFAKINKEDYYKIKPYSWSVKETKKGFIAVSNPTKNKNRLTMHRFLLDIGDDRKIEIDHKNGNTLDNTKENIRIANKSKNMANTMKSLGRTSLYKGVCFNNRLKLWISQISINKHQKTKYFKNEIDAAIQYDNWAREGFGEFACVNFPKENERGCLCQENIK